MQMYDYEQIYCAKDHLPSVLIYTQTNIPTNKSAWQKNACSVILCTNIYTHAHIYKLYTHTKKHTPTNRSASQKNTFSVKLCRCVYVYIYMYTYMHTHEQIRLAKEHLLFHPRRYTSNGAQNSIKTRWPSRVDKYHLYY